ncbi:sensor histidine kinase [Oceanobacillus sp. CAU 1775]
MLLQNGEKAMDRVIEDMLSAVQHSKDEIFNISEDSKREYELLQNELQDTKQLVLDYIEQGDLLEKKVRDSRKRLAEVSRNFDKYSEKDIHDVYENTHNLQSELIRLRDKEHYLRRKRDEIERRLLRISKTIDRAEGLVSKISVIENYLQVDFYQVNEMIESAKEKQEFGLKIIEAQEEERRRLSREIHDGPAQMLANILLRSEIIERTLKEKSTEIAIEELRKTREMVRSSLYEVRRIIYDLRPMALDDLGLIPTIKKYIDNLSDFHKISIDFVVLGEDKRLQSKYEVALFRLLQESVQNAVKHADPSEIQIKIQVESNFIVLVVKDNGKGFDVTIKKENSFGLIGMRERVQMLNGELDIHSQPNAGTTVIIKLPYLYDED